MSIRFSRSGIRHLGVTVFVALGCAGPPADNGHDAVTRISAGIEFFEARAAADPHDYLSQRQLVRRYGERFAVAATALDLVRAETAAHALLARSPDRSGAWGRLSAVLLMQHRFAEALAAADSAVALEPAGADAIGARFDAALAIGHYRAAHEALVQLPARDMATRARWAAWHQLTGHPAAAREAQALTCAGLDHAGAPPLARAWCLTELGGLTAESADEAEAVAIFRNALAVQPGYRGALEGLADLAHAREDWASARELYTRILSDAHPDLYRRLAEVERGLGQMEAATEAEDQFRVLVSAPGQEAMQGPEIVAHLLQAGGHWQDSALAVAEREVARRPTLESWQMLARVFQIRNDSMATRRADAMIAGIQLDLARLTAHTPAP
ncbi:MAG: hypothetical protein ABR551_09835 [Gemmatimonadales bacterium]